MFFEIDASPLAKPVEVRDGLKQKSFRDKQFPSQNENLPPQARKCRVPRQRSWDLRVLHNNRKTFQASESEGRGPLWSRAREFHVRKTLHQTAQRNLSL